MELIVLGSSGTWPNADTATSGYLVRHDGFNLWMDAGTGTLANLQQHIDIPDLDAIVISHEHPDHFVDLYPAFYAWHYGELGEPGLPVFVPTDFSQRLADLVSIDSQVAMRSASVTKGIVAKAGGAIQTVASAVCIGQLLRRPSGPCPPVRPSRRPRLVTSSVGGGVWPSCWRCSPHRSAAPRPSPRPRSPPRRSSSTRTFTP